MKVLYITYDGLTDSLGGSQVLPYIKACASKDLTFHILSYEKAGGSKILMDEIRADLTSRGIQWTARRYHKKPALFSTFYDIADMMIQARGIVKYDRAEVLHCRGYIAAFAAFSIRRWHKIKVLFDIRGFWADERLEGGIWKRSNPLHQWMYRYLKRKELYWWKASDHVISLTEKGKEIIMKKVPEIVKEGISIIPCCADENLFKIPMVDERRTLRKELNVSDADKIMVYVGSLGTWYMAREMMRTFRVLSESKVVDRFLWVTKGDSEMILNLAKDENVDPSNILIRKAGRTEVAEYLKLADLGIFFIRPTFSKWASSPTKLGEMLMAGLPVIANRGVGDLDQIFTVHQVGMLINVDECNQIVAEKVEEIMKYDRAEIRKVGLATASLSFAKERYLAAYNLLK
ncbi:MAG: glycosyltransferase [Vicingaceae bacterium]